jgi:NAD(P)-dependent dehydrogenase (short-subunit alcohol dehydrogenase family)
MGKATAIGFGKLGANVALLDLNEEGARHVADEVDATGAHAAVWKVDMADTRAVRSTLQAVHERFGALDAVTNVAAVYPITGAADITEEFWDEIISVDLRGVFFCCQEALRIMGARGSGAIVNVASSAAFRPVYGQTAYAAAKAGLVGMSRVLAFEYARSGIRINVVAPGYTLTEGALALAADNHIDVEALAETLLPGRFMTPEEQANAIIWLCSDAASGLNGAIINVTGGTHMP